MIRNVCFTFLVINSERLEHLYYISERLMSLTTVFLTFNLHVFQYAHLQIAHVDSFQSNQSYSCKYLFLRLQIYVTTNIENFMLKFVTQLEVVNVIISVVLIKTIQRKYVVGLHSIMRFRDTNYILVQTQKARPENSCYFIFFFCYIFEIFQLNSCHIIMRFEHKNDGAEQSCVHNDRY